MIRLIFFIFCLFFSIAQVCHGLEVTFRPSASVDGASITLADVADFDIQSDMTLALGSQIISASPPPGQEILLQTGSLRQYLIGALSIPSSVGWNGPSSIRVHRKGITLGPEKIQSVIAEFLRQHRNDLPEAEIYFTPTTLPLPFILPSGDLTWEVIPSNPGILSSTSMSLIFKVDGHVRKNIAIAGHMEAIAPVAVAASEIERGSTVSPEQIHVVSRNIADHSSPCFDPRDIIGKKTNRTIKEGSVFERTWIEIPPMVARGQMVKILLNSGELHLTTTGIANMNGLKDQVIRVQNINSKKMIYCRVTAPGVVEVQI
jgi:flagellar basal body P-ring formation protein FlgA